MKERFVVHRTGLTPMEPEALSAIGMNPTGSLLI